MAFQTCSATLFALILLFISFPAGWGQSDEPTADWPRWRGPDQSGASTAADPPVQWSEKQNLRWKTPVTGEGHATPIVFQGQVFVSAAEPIGTDDGSGLRQRLLVSSFDLQTGVKRWQTEVAQVQPHEAGHVSNTHASASPVTDGKRLYVSFGSHGVFCLDLAGSLRWKTDLGTMTTRRQYGEGGSPAIANGTLVIPWDHEEQSFLFALDAQSGRQRWRVPRDEPTTWATPLLTRYENRWQVVTNGVAVKSYDLQSGELLWQRGTMTTNPIPSPVRYNDNVICMTGYRGYSIVSAPLSSKGSSDLEEDVNWMRSDAAPYVASPVLWKDTLYFTKSREGIVAAVDARDGKSVIAPTRISELSTVYASPVAARDRIYFVGRNGTTVVLRHGPELEILSTNRIDEGVDASPVLSGGSLILRGKKHLYCFSEAPPSEENAVK